MEVERVSSWRRSLSREKCVSIAGKPDEVGSRTFIGHGHTVENRLEWEHHASRVAETDATLEVLDVNRGHPYESNIYRYCPFTNPAHHSFCRLPTLNRHGNYNGPIRRS